MLVNLSLVLNYEFSDGNYCLKDPLFRFLFTFRAFYARVLALIYYNDKFCLKLR